METTSYHSNVVRRGLGVAGLAVVLAFSAAATAQAAPAAPAAVLSGDGVTADCTYVAIRNTVVRSGPGTEYPVVRTKTAGQHMTGPALCVASNGWFRVYLSTGTLGYTPAADVRFVS
ncbi:SH3 domain-containing protein [Amycolatopsis sp. NPDC049688]|uniref:SH3 domain-containing protein n=1 Tax=Amycolatopsis sp. NPDC049688 TaxID=3154733 RepID=UPI003434A7E9